MNASSVSVWSLFLRGGWVMWPILLLSLISFSIILERIFYYLFRAKTVISESAAELDGIKMPNPLPTPDYWESVVQKKTQSFIEGAERGLGILSAIATLSPLLGLLGTVTGMVRSFMVIERLGWQVNPGILAGGIWEALLTTVFGLAVAIPTLLAYFIFDALASRSVQKFHLIAMEKKQKQLVRVPLDE